MDVEEILSFVEEDTAGFLPFSQYIVTYSHCVNAHLDLQIFIKLHLYSGEYFDFLLIKFKCLFL